MVSPDTKDKKNSGVLGSLHADSLALLRVQPIDRDKERTRYCFGRVIVEDLSKQVLKEIFNEANAEIDVIEDEQFYNLQYKNHKVLKISKKDGLFYSKHMGMNQEARIIWEILRKNGFINNPHRKHYYKNTLEGYK